jgi:phosphohistidine phosphatase
MTPTAKHKLIIMRHAKSDWDVPYGGDFERPLAGRGARDAPRMGNWLLEQGLIPELIVSSPAQRARQTAQLVAQQLQIPAPEIMFEEDLYMAELDTLLEVINRHLPPADSLLLVGHNPGLDGLVEYLSDRRPEYRKGKLMTTAAIAVLDYGSAGRPTQPHGARLEQLIRPRDLTE